MLLAIDVGNTNSVFALFDGEHLVSQWRMATNASRTSDEYGLWLRQMLALNDRTYSEITDVILATVVPRVQFELVSCCKKYFHVEPMLVDSALDVPDLSVDVDHPEEVGADRLVNAYEGWKRYQCGMVIIDFGTATTFDVVTKEGVYIGGVIAPGVNLSLDALQKAAAKLPSIGVRCPSHVIGRNTVAAMESGIYYGYVGMIEGLLNRIKKEYGDIEKVIATGGLAPLYVRSIPQIDDIVSDLTIYGLASIYYTNNNFNIINYNKNEEAYGS
ncbi:MAG: type III pantothenate kinase [Alphaproteobacteria bacterium]|nr:MAG: type III pantothenate kinase [Alphaproteobacteria bacterium]